MKICFLSTKHTPFDKRVFEKEAKSLLNAGFTVYHLAPFASDDKPFTRDGVVIVPLRPVTNIKSRIMHSFGTFRKALQINADCYHCNEVDSWFIGVLLKIFFKKLVVFDVHEHYPSNFSESRFPKLLRPLIEFLTRILFQILLPFTDKLVLAKKSVAVDFPGSEHKQVLVQNYSPSCLRNPEQHKAKYTEERIKIVHLGLFSKIRGWPQFLDALEILKNEGLSRPLEINMIGEINDGSQAEFIARSESLGGNLEVNLYEWMPYDRAFSLLTESHIGVILFQPGPKNHTHSFPHKLFDYMRAGMAVVAPSFAVEVSEIVSRENCGVLVDPANPQSIADALKNLLSSNVLCMKLGQNGQEAIQQRLNWDQESKKLIFMYHDLTNPKNKKSQSRSVDEDHVSCAA